MPQKLFLLRILRLKNPLNEYEKEQNMKIQHTQHHFVLVLNKAHSACLSVCLLVGYKVYAGRKLG